MYVDANRESCANRRLFRARIFVRAWLVLLRVRTPFREVTFTPKERANPQFSSMHPRPIPLAQPVVILMEA